MSQSNWQGSQESGRGKRHLFLPGPSCGPSLSPETVAVAYSSNGSDDISRVMPGKKEFVSMKKAGKRRHIQSRVLCNLREVYHEFKERFSDCKVGF